MSRELDGNKSFFKSVEDKNYMTREQGRVACNVIDKPWVSNVIELHDYESGSTILLGDITAAGNIKLPMPQKGLQYVLIATDENSAHAVTVKSWTHAATRAVGNTKFRGICQGGATGVSIDSDVGLTFVASKISTGDHITLTSDGDKWYVQAVIEIASGVVGL